MWVNQQKEAHSHYSVGSNLSKGHACLSIQMNRRKRTAACTYICITAGFCKKNG